MEKKKKDKLMITIVILDILVLIGFFITYGPISYFRNLLITTAMTTRTHQYLAYIFYNDDIIRETMNANVVKKFDDTTDTSAIKFNNTIVDNGEYANEFEEQVLKRDEGNDLYKVFTVKYKRNTIHMLVVYDPSRISMVLSKKISRGGQMMTSIAKDNEAIAAINASGYNRNRTTGALTPFGAVISNGKIISGSPGTNQLIGFNEDNVLVLTYDDAETAIKNGMRDAMTFGPFLIMNGEKAEMKGDGGWGYAPRTAIAQRKDGIVLFSVSDGRGKGSPGLSMVQLADFLYQYGAYNAANLDGGGSSMLVVNNKLVNDPGGYTYTGERYVCNAWILK
mgnify:CR=1 FL=1